MTASAEAASAREANAPAAEQAELNKKAESAAAKAREERGKATEAVEGASLEAPDLEPLAFDIMPRRSLTRKADGTPTHKSQRNHHFAEACGYTVRSLRKYHSRKHVSPRQKLIYCLFQLSAQGGLMRPVWAVFEAFGRATGHTSGQSAAHAASIAAGRSRLPRRIRL